jgi:hypothetical protein
MLSAIYTIQEKSFRALILKYGLIHPAIINPMVKDI